MLTIKLPLLNKKPKSLVQKPNDQTIRQKSHYPAFSANIKNCIHQSNPHNTIDMPGPGHYNISKPIVKPIIQTINKNNNSIIIKINEMGSAVFKGCDSRINFQKSEKSPGPGSYLNKDIQTQLIRSKKNIKMRNSMIHYKQKFKDLFNVKKRQDNPFLNISPHNDPQNQLSCKAIHSKKIKNKQSQQKIICQQSTNSISMTLNYKTIIPHSITSDPSSPNPQKNTSINNKLYDYEIYLRKKIENNKFKFFNSTQKRLIIESQCVSQYKAESQSLKMQDSIRSQKVNKQLKKQNSNLILQNKRYNSFNHDINKQ